MYQAWAYIIFFLSFKVLTRLPFALVALATFVIRLNGCYVGLECFQVFPYVNIISFLKNLKSSKFELCLSFSISEYSRDPKGNTGVLSSSFIEL